MKKAYVIWTAEAIVDLEIIFDFLVEKSPSAAQRTIENILARAKQLENYPESGAIQETIRKEKDYRYLVESNYKIIYSFQNDLPAVFVETIFDTRQNPLSLRV